MIDRSKAIIIGTGDVLNIKSGNMVCISKDKTTLHRLDRSGCYYAKLAPTNKIINNYAQHNKQLLEIKHKINEIKSIQEDYKNKQYEINRLYTEYHQVLKNRDYEYTYSYYSILEKVIEAYGKEEWFIKMKKLYGSGIILMCDRSIDGFCDRLVAEYLGYNFTERDYLENVLGEKSDLEDRIDRDIYIPELMVDELGREQLILPQRYKRVLVKVMDVRWKNGR